MKRVALGVLLALSLVVQGCGIDELVESRLELPKGEAIFEALGATVNDVLKSLENSFTNGPRLIGPDNVSPPSDLFEDSVATAPGLRPLSEGAQLSAWQGPETGPDGEAGWYYREASAQLKSSGGEGEENTWKWRYWLRFEPAADVRNGLASISAERTHYAYTAENGTWNDWNYIISFSVTQMRANLLGRNVPSQVEGTWSWKIGENASNYRGSRLEGSYTLDVFDFDGSGEDGISYYDLFESIKIGKTKNISIASSSKFDYQGVFYSYENVLESKWYGGGTSKLGGSLSITRKNESTVTVASSDDSSSVNYWGQGERPTDLDLLDLPPFMPDKAPAGDVWGIPVWDTYPELTARDGLLHWSKDNENSIFSNSLDFRKEKDIDDRVREAQAVLDDPNATEEAKAEAEKKLEQANKEADELFADYSAIIRSQSTSLQWDGAKQVQGIVYCTSPDLAADCPKRD